MSIAYSVWTALGGIWHNHPTGVATFGLCVNDCGEFARGSGECDECLKKKLTELTDNPGDVDQYVMAIKNLRQLEIRLIESAEKKANLA